MSIEAMKQALEALCSANPIGHALEDYEYHNKATEALRQAIEQAENQEIAVGIEAEPVAYIKDREIGFMLGVKQVGGTYWKTSLGFTREPGDIGLYTEAQVRQLLEKQNEKQDQMP
jgi:hypothetical protein